MDGGDTPGRPVPLDGAGEPLGLGGSDGETVPVAAGRKVGEVLRGVGAGLPVGPMEGSPIDGNGIDGSGNDGNGIGSGIVGAGVGVGRTVGLGVGMGVGTGVGVTVGPATTTMGGTLRSAPDPPQS